MTGVLAINFTARNAPLIIPPVQDMLRRLEALGFKDVAALLRERPVYESVEKAMLALSDSVVDEGALEAVALLGCIEMAFAVGEN